MPLHGKRSCLSIVTKKRPLEKYNQQPADDDWNDCGGVCARHHHQPHLQRDSWATREA